MVTLLLDSPEPWLTVGTGEDGTSHTGQWPVTAPLLPTHPTGPVMAPPLQPSSLDHAVIPHQSSSITKGHLGLPCPPWKSSTEVGPAVSWRPQPLIPAHCSEQGQQNDPGSKDVDQKSVCMGSRAFLPFRKRRREPFLPGMNLENSCELSWDTRDGTEIITPLILLLQRSTPVNQHRSHLSTTLGAIRADPGLSDKVIESLQHSRRAPWP